MRPRRVQAGQIWTREGSGEAYLVTKVYNEAVLTFALLRKAGAEDEAPLRVQVKRLGGEQVLDGFSFMHESEEF